jgi:hypothetical protein
MRLTTQFRARATECLKLADAADSLESRAYWTSMASLWHELATHLEHAYPNSEGSSIFAPDAGRGSCQGPGQGAECST